MKCRHMWRAVLVILAVQIVLGQHAVGQTKLGLHVTQEELNIWKQRAQSGPYKSLGDVSPNSPGDWDRITQNAEWFRSNSTEGIVLGPSGACVNKSFISPPNTDQVKARKMRDAAFYALVKQDIELKNKVKNLLLSQSTQPNLDFSDRSNWCVGPGINPEGIWGYAQWLKILLFAMDYIEILDPDVFTSNEKTHFRNWFVNYAEMANENNNISFNSYFVDRMNDDYTPTPGADFISIPAYYGSKTFSRYGRYWNNRRSDVMTNVALIGIKFNIRKLQDDAKRYVKETVRFGVFPEGFVTDFDRWWKSDGSHIPDLGWQYAHGNIGHVVTIADALARVGDTEAYDYVTSQGLYGSEGGQKSLLFAIQSLAKYVDHTFDRYGTDQASQAGDPAYRIDGRYADGRQNPGLISMVHGNVYYKDPYFKSVYMRKAPGTVPYPGKYQVISNGPHSPWQGAAAIYPGVLFMFGDMEGKVWPYPGKELAPPKNLKIMGSSS